MKIVTLIPARLDSSRFPGKMLALLGAKTVIRTTYETVKNMNLFDDLYVVTDSGLIFEEIVSHGGKAIRSTKKHISGTDRIAEAAEKIDADIFVNIQGDEPFVRKEPLQKLISCFDDPYVDVATLMQKLTNQELIADPNYVKVASAQDGTVLYFSRSPIPFDRDGTGNVDYFEHIGVYAFRKNALLRFSSLPPSPLELCEKIEPLRFLENGMKIKVIETDYMGIEIDTPEDLEKATSMIMGE